jgi:aspartyl/asparaginyl-tRNA synthetase
MCYSKRAELICDAEIEFATVERVGKFIKTALSDVIESLREEDEKGRKFIKIFNTNRQNKLLPKK